MPKAKKINPNKASKAIQDIQDILFLEAEGYNGNKEWNVEMLDRIAEAVAKAIPRPPECDVCDECETLIPQTGGSLANKYHARSCSLYDAKGQDHRGPR